MSSKRKRKPNRTERERRQEIKATNEFDAVVEDMAATFTCSTEVTHDLAWQCGHSIEELDDDLQFNRIAYEFWQDRPLESKKLAQTIKDFITERERHQAALTVLEARFIALEEADEHHHLEPIETYRERVREQLSMARGPENSESDEAARRPSNYDEF